jgi:RNA polymerase sigma-70 factor (ECF subfamily)
MKSKKHFPIQDSESDEALYIAWCEGDRDAANVLLQKYQSQVLMMAYHYSKNSEITKDITQNVWIEICKKAKFNHEIRSFKSFIFVVCRNKFLDHFRKNKNSKESSSPPNELPDDRSFSLEKQIDQKEKVQLSKQLIFGLPPLQKECFTLYVLEEMSMEEIAIQLNISVNQVRGRIDRAKRRMKNLKKKIQ